jgi:hypothetical protein
MKKLAIAAGLAALLMCPSLASATLKEMYDAAPSGQGFDKLVQLQTGVVYTGGLYIGKTFNRINAAFEGDEGRDVRIEGNGAVLDLQGGEICISYCSNRLEIDDCVIINGSVRFRGIEDGLFVAKPRGSVTHVTFFEPHDYGVRVFFCGNGITIERNIVVDAVDTGDDFLYLSGYASTYLPTGHSVAFSSMGYGTPLVVDNWSYHSDPEANANPMRHFSLLCEYG